MNFNKDLISDSTVVVLLSDLNYWNKAKRTIYDLRIRGEWTGEIVFIPVDFEPNKTFTDFYKLTIKKFPRLDLTHLIEQINKHPFINSDRREYNKLTQWEKLHIFDDYFRNWKRVFFVDAGLRIFDNIKYFLEIDYTNKFLSQNDNGVNGPNKTFGCQLEVSNSSIIDNLKNDICCDILDKPYFLNCLWIYDTCLLDVIKKNELIEIMNKYPVCRTNEMGVMNILINCKLNLWTPLPYYNSEGKYLFDWCESNFNPRITWRDICSLKYPISINFDCE